MPTTKIANPRLIFHISEAMVLIVNGYDVDHKSNAQTCQMIDLERPTTCHGLEDYPVASQGAVGAVVSDQPLICGGFVQDSERQSIQSGCYKHIRKSNKWTFVANMTVNRMVFDAAETNGKLFIAGGMNFNTV